MSKKPAPNRREVMAGGVATAIAASVPVWPASTGLSFAAMQARLEQAMTALATAREAAIAARPQIVTGMRRSKRRIDAYFAAEEVKALGRARMEARAAAEEILFASAGNDAEIALQEKVRAMFMTGFDTGHRADLAAGGA